MSKNNEITLADTLVFALNELQTAINNNNDKRIGEIEKFLWIVYDVAEKHFSGKPMKVIGFVDDMTACINDYFCGALFKCNFPTEQEIRTALED